jgi:hypothetical protein
MASLLFGKLFQSIENPVCPWIDGNRRDVAPENATALVEYE